MRNWWNVEIEKDLDCRRRNVRSWKIQIIKHAKIDGNSKDSRINFREIINRWWKMQAWKLKMSFRWRKINSLEKVASNWERNWNCCSKSVKIKERERSMAEGYGRKRKRKKEWIGTRKITWETKTFRVLRKGKRKTLMNDRKGKWTRKLTLKRTRRKRIINPKINGNAKENTTRQRWRKKMNYWGFLTRTWKRMREDWRSKLNAWGRKN